VRDTIIHTQFLLERQKGRGYLEYPGIDGRIILEWILEGRGGKV
jgi:hypothetical protein